MLIASYAPEGQRGRPPFAVEAMLRIHFLQQFRPVGSSDGRSAAQRPLYREFARLDNWTVRLLDESTILRFRHLLEKHKLAAQILTLVNDVLRDKRLMLRAARECRSAHTSQLCSGLVGWRSAHSVPFNGQAHTKRFCAEHL
ncbi:transposase [Burkholderia sp. AU6039]|uniref:transposase n=1 Tax=Burkholderia sp. AU6039 TaxID=2015344 RepID=UPI000B7A4BAD|nr:transposase [Burkholderia sp. AU6039]OXJ06778.1 hypothetical protein CFB39_38355 [Burkholderia sp. AU6039]